MQNNLRKLVRQIIKEGKIEVLQSKYPDLNIFSLAKKDPSSTKKYLTWIIKQLKHGEEEERIFSAINMFDKVQQRLEKKDINQYHSVNELEKELINLKPSRRTRRKKIKSEGAEKIYENEEYDVYYIFTKAACALYGSNTQWCITMKNKEHWENYTEDNNFYFAIRKNPTGDELDKVAFMVGKNNTIVSNSKDKQIRIPLSMQSIAKAIFNDSKIRGI